MERINFYAPRLWLIGIGASLLMNLHRIQLSYNQRQVSTLLGSLTSGSGASQLLSHPKELISDKELRKICKDALQDLIDLVIPLSMMGWINVSPGTVGIAGAITSLMGATSIYPPTA